MTDLNDVIRPEFKDSQEKVKQLDDLQKVYKEFIETVNTFKCQQSLWHNALIRFEEGKMWLQSAIVHYELKLSPVYPEKTANESTKTSE